MNLINRAYEWYASGKYSLLDIKKLAQDAGLAYKKSGKPVSKSDIDRILRNPIYYGDFFWNKKLYPGNHQAIVSRELWDAAQWVRSGRHKTQKRGGKQRWSFQGLLTCGHCGCALTAEKRKGKYIYYHCTGHKGKCPEKYVREEVLAEQFGEYLKLLCIDDEVLDWIRDTLHSSHDDQKKFHEESISALQTRYSLLENRINRAYEDKLDGKVDDDFFDEKNDLWRNEQIQILKSIESHQKAEEKYMAEGIKILELVQRAYSLYKKQPNGEKRRLLNFVFSNCTFANGRIRPQFRKPFDSLIESNIAHQKKKGRGW